MYNYAAVDAGTMYNYAATITLLLTLELHTITLGHDD
jgi:hypothetical protein